MIGIGNLQGDLGLFLLDTSVVSVLIENQGFIHGTQCNRLLINSA